MPTLRLDDITIDDEVQPRVAGLDSKTVKEYAERIKEGDGFPPVVVFNDGKKKWLSEGFHRVAAYKLAGVNEVPVDVRKGTRDDAKLNALASNKSHGLRRSNADKRRAVESLLKMRPAWSNRRSADFVGVSDEFVRSVRDEQVPTVGTCEPQKREGKDGKSYTVPTPKPKPVPVVEPETEPEAGGDSDPDIEIDNPAVAPPETQPKPEPVPVPPSVPPAPTWRDLPVGNPHEPGTESHKRAEKAFAWAKITTMGQLADFLDTDHGGFALKPWEERHIASHLAKHRVAAEPPDAPWRATSLDLLAVSNPVVHQRLTNLDITTLGHLSDRLDAGANFGFPLEILAKLRGLIRDARDGRPPVLEPEPTPAVAEPTPTPAETGTPDASTNADTPYIHVSTSDTASTDPLNWRLTPIDHLLLTPATFRLLAVTHKLATVGDLWDRLEAGERFGIPHAALVDIRDLIVALQPASEPEHNTGRRKVSHRGEWERGLKLFKQGARILADLVNGPSGVFLRGVEFGEPIIATIRTKRPDGGTREDCYFPGVTRVARAVAALMPARTPCAGCGGEGRTDSPRGPVVCVACQGHGCIPHDPTFKPDQGRPGDLFDESELW